MNENEWLAGHFEEHRGHLRAVAYRMLGSLAEADDAVQDAWIRVNRAGADGVENIGGWLTTIVARVCLNALRSRNTRHEQSLAVVPDPLVSINAGHGPEDEAVLADSVGLALMVVLEQLEPSERLAFVLHDMFKLPFADIAPIIDRGEDAARQLASRARRRVSGAAPPRPGPDIARQREVVDAFFRAARLGDFDALVAVLHPHVELRIDTGPSRPTASAVVTGAITVASQAILFANPRQVVEHVTVNGVPGAVMRVGGRPISVAAFTIVDDRIVSIDGIADPERVERILALAHVDQGRRTI